MKLRSFVSRLIRKHRCIPPASILAGAIIFALMALEGVTVLWIFGAVAILMFASYVWGYATRAFRVIAYPSLLNLQRRQYGEVWDALAGSPSLAKIAACGEEDENALRRSAKLPVKNLTDLVGIHLHDDVLEFGCGVARVGLELAPRCRTWIGADLSANMLASAAERLAGVTNIKLVKLNQVGLDEFEDNSFDLVYSTNMLDHLDGMDRWRYVRDAFRVLRPGGRLYIDNIDLEPEEGWRTFSRDADASQELERPPFMPAPSTAAELTTYAKRAGFAQVQAHKRSPLVIVTAVKMPSV